MSGAELQVAVSLSLVLGAILGALLCTYVRAGRNRLIPSGAAFQACQELRAELESLQEALQAACSYAPSAVRNETSSGQTGDRRPASPAPAAAPTEAFDEPVSSTQHPPNLAAWRRLERPSAAAHTVVRQSRPAQTEIVAPVRRRSRTANRPALIDPQTAHEIVMRHFGVSVAPMPNPGVAARAGRSDKVIPMPPARSGAAATDEQHSLAL